MAKAGLIYGGSFPADGKLHRFKAHGDKERNSWFVLFPDPPVAGAFGCWKRGIKLTWCEKEPKSLSDAEWTAIRRRWQDADRERECDEVESHRKAQQVAAWILSRSSSPASHTYLAKKGVKAYGNVREWKGALVLPLRDAAGELQSLQFIDADGSKRFLRGGRVQGCLFTLADTSEGPLVIAEGFATAASILEATGFAVVCAMDCGNLNAVAQALRAKWPERELILAADDDRRTEGNPGLSKATEAAKAVKAKLAVPRFQDLSSHPTDFNDLHQMEGLAPVKAQMDSAQPQMESDEDRLQRLAKLSLIDFDRCEEDEAKAMGVRAATLRAEVAKQRAKLKAASPQGSAANTADLEPWPDPVDGVALLEEIGAAFKRFCVLPPYASDVLAVWVLQTYCYTKFDFAAVIAVWSPEAECGKGRVLDVAEKLAHRAFRTANTSAAVLYHSVSHGDITVLIDELDSQQIEQREAIGNILKSGFQSNGRAHRMTERSGEQVVIEFSTYCPKMLATIGLDALDKATRTRSIGIRMQRKKREDKIAKFRRYDGTEIKRKCLRWLADNARALEAVGPMDIDECATDRQEDVWEPLVAIARVCGGDRESRIRAAARNLSGAADTAATQTLGHQILSAMHEQFAANGDRLDTKTLIERLNSSGDFCDVNRGRGVTPYFLANHLKPYGIAPRNLKIEGKVLKGYDRASFDDAFQTYLAPPGPAPTVSNRYSATEVENIGQKSLFESATEPNGSVSKNEVSTNVCAGGSGVADSTPGSAPDAAKDSIEPAPEAQGKSQTPAEDAVLV